MARYNCLKNQETYSVFKNRTDLFPTWGPLVKYAANNVNSYREKNNSARQAKVKWLCEEQFRSPLLLQF